MQKILAFINFSVCSYAFTKTTSTPEGKLEKKGNLEVPETFIMFLK